MFMAFIFLLESLPERLCFVVLFRSANAREERRGIVFGRQKGITGGESARATRDRGN